MRAGHRVSNQAYASGDGQAVQLTSSYPQSMQQPGCM
jgi:hypothetical protein